MTHRYGSTADDQNRISADVRFNGEIREIEATGNGPISAFIDAIAESASGCGSLATWRRR
ncbi:alpha-isopropylmalate synthase regulatory domain-containing protein [Nonomuraea sp. CA-141351]|uniref:alpha-isopropylmalate synthase regulatory domain-containing protein n=1 Tax=Nonomuraea sp. CA-141351 TaxID=3239996 RepID=UPI003D8D3B0C